MDREIPKAVRNKERNKKIIRFSAIGVGVVVVIGVLISVMRTGVQKEVAGRRADASLQARPTPGEQPDEAIGYVDAD